MEYVTPIRVDGDYNHSNLPDNDASTNIHSTRHAASGIRQSYSTFQLTRPPD